MGTADDRNRPSDEPSQRLDPGACDRESARRYKPSQGSDHEPLDQVGYEESKADNGHGEISSEFHVKRLRRIGVSRSRLRWNIVQTGTR